MNRAAIRSNVVALAVVLACAVQSAAAQGVQTADAQVLMSEARRYFDALDYEHAVAALDRAIALLAGRSADEAARKELIAGYGLRARSRFGLGDQAGAREDVVSLLKLAPDFRLTGEVSPRVVALFDEALKETVTTLNLSVAPDTAEVRLDGVPVAPTSSIPIAIGDHVVTARRLGYRDVSLPLVVEANKTAEVTLALERVSAVLNILTSPANVEVVIDGISHGKTVAGPPPARYAEAATKVGVPPADVSSVMVVANLAQGSHLVEFKRECYIGVERRVAIDKPDDYSIDAVKLEHAVATLSVRANQPGAQVFVDGQVRGVAPYSTSELCEGEHTVELRSISGRHFKRVQARTGDKLEVAGTIKPGFALVAAVGTASALNTDLRVIIERALEPAQSVTVFAPASDQIEQATKAQQLPAGWFAFDGKRRPIGVTADISAPIRQDLSLKLARTFDAQGIASVTVPSPFDRNRVVVSLLGAGSGQPDVLELSLDNPESIRAAIARLDRTISFFRPSIGLSAIDVADVPGAAVVSMDANGPAAKAGVQVGDVITKVNGQAISDALALATTLATHKANDDVTLELKPRTGAAKRADMKVFMTPRLIGMADQTLLANAMLLDLRARLLTPGDPVEESVIRLNVAAALARLEAWSDARTELQRVKLPDGPGVANGTVQYLLGVCADQLGNRAEAETAWKAAATSDSLLTEDGPSVKELAEARLADLQRSRR